MFAEIIRNKMKTTNSAQRENNEPEMKIAKSAQREKQNCFKKDLGIDWNDEQVIGMDLE